jgi:hypothetical protein
MSESYASKLTEVDPKIFIEPPDADWQNPLNPDGTRKIPAGDLCTSWDDSNFQMFYPPAVTGKKPYPRLKWVRWYFWIPKGVYKRQSLQVDGTWRDAGTIDGPFDYLELGEWDGDGHALQRLMAT